MKRIQTLETRDLAQSAQHGGCGDCKTSCGVANQVCENQNNQ